MEGRGGRGARTHSRARPARGPGQRRAPSGAQLQGSGQRVPRSARDSGGSSSSSTGSCHSAGDLPMVRSMCAGSCRWASVLDRPRCCLRPLPAPRPAHPARPGLPSCPAPPPRTPLQGPALLGLGPWLASPSPPFAVFCPALYNRIWPKF